MSILPTTEPETPQAVPVSQLSVVVYAINEYGSSVPVHQRDFVNTAEGAAAQHLMAWVAQNFMEPPTVEASDEPASDA